MLLLLSARHHDAFRIWLADMHRLRYRIFKENLGWAVQVTDGQEIDRFDQIGPSYIVYLDAKLTIRGCVRLLPTSGPNMLRDVFPQLVDTRKIPRDPKIWESSRFAMDLAKAEIGNGIVHTSPAMLLFLGMIEFGLAQGVSAIVTVTDTRIEHLLRRVQWPLQRLGEPKVIGSVEAVAGLLEISEDSLQRLREAAGVSFPVLWMPAERSRK